MKYLIIGDLHLSEPNKIPEVIINLAKKMDGIICTGDLTSKIVLEKLKKMNKTFFLRSKKMHRRMTRDLIVVKGNCDTLVSELIDLPEYLEFEVENKKIGVIHSHQFGRGNLEKIKEFANSKKLDVIIFGHTHQPLIEKRGNLFLINPGTLTGAISGKGIQTEKTYAILEIGKDINAKINRL
ncbi:MAG: metallophosphoesterase [Candidatus Aenigmarchaeota archaeon]|nr:metallophosphoesterase [Candidatus Aenigmarchaeota archaeon]